ncbi:MAG TPA: preprotein translocase subunit YajC [Propionibacteriaceae bacterium]|nr:preprotein translocase subunit YajC [Propionibacteriaceae bacterium]
MPGFDPTTILLLLGVVALAYFMLIRPQQKRAKEQRDLMAALMAGDRVMTISGIVGTIRYLGEKQAIIEISPGVEMTVVKAAISSQPVDDEFEYSEAGEVSASEGIEPAEVESTDTDESAGEDQSK